jgi:hypothetical protein
MSTTPNAYLYNGQPAVSDAALYTASGSPAVFSKLIAVNPTADAITLSLSVIRAISGVTEAIASALPIPARSAVSLLTDYELELAEYVLDPNDALHGSASGTGPAAPVPTNAASGGTVAAGTYGVEVTYTSAGGETVASAAATVTTSGSTSTLTVPSPPANANATGWYAYVTQAGGSTYTRQQAAGSPTAIGTALTLTAPPSSSGAQPPSVAGVTVTAF